MIIKTPSGNSVSVKYTSELTMCDYSKYAGLIAEYNATSVSVASVTFNCHSFAWLNGYRSDSYYEKSSVAQAGDIAYWGTHSAIVQYTNKDDPDTPINAPENYCISKWDAGPIVAHYMKRCPYYAENSTVNYYRPAE